MFGATDLTNAFTVSNHAIMRSTNMKQDRRTTAPVGNSGEESQHRSFSLRKNKVFYTKRGEALAQLTHRGDACLIPGDIRAVGVDDF